MRTVFSGAAIIFCLWGGVLPSADAVNSSIVTVTVNVLENPCTVNNNQIIDVNFGDSVITTDAEAGKVSVPVDFTLTCDDAISNDLTMTIKGTPASYDTDGSLLSTNLSALAIQLKENGLVFPFNKAINFTYPGSIPSLDAVLVVKPGERLPTGEFSAGATMIVDYQ
ncbi:fimbrial protein [Salmonella enterica]|nr:fimbrial protein [Salmonella enterica]